jgi:glycolate oxidase FAD binding subunit
VVAYDPADLTVTIGAGTRCDELAEGLGAAGQECALDPRDGRATVGGVLATGLSGHRRLRLGPLRDRVLEVRFVTADGRLVKAGGPTVKNVSGFDLPRLLVGSLGTVGVLVQVTLRCQPRPASSEWFTTAVDPFAVRRALHRPTCLAWDGTTTHVLLEGVPADVDAERVRIGAPAARSAGPAWPDGAHRGRVSVRPSALRDLAAALDRTGVRWLAEVGVGTVHVATDDEAALARARTAAEATGGWLLREAGAPNLDGFGATPPNVRLAERVRRAFDPTGKCSPGRLPGEPSDD